MFFKKLFNIKNIEVEFNKNLTNKLSFKPQNMLCFCYILCKTENSLKNVLKILKKYQKKYYFLGNGSNTIFENNFYNGFILQFAKNKIKINKNYLKISSDINFFKLHRILMENSLGGLEWAFGIPASVGGAVFMNAGAYGNEISSFVEKVKVLFDGKIFWTKNFWFTYRNSSFQENNMIILEVVFKLENSSPNKILNLQTEYLKKRKLTQPLNFPSAGSVFKRQENIIPAKLIDELNLKGKKHGGAAVSTKHAGFIVNKKAANCRDYFLLASEIKNIVQEKANINLHFEVKFVK